MTTVGTVTTVGRFTFDSATNEVSGPAEYIRSAEYRQLIASIEGGTNHTFRAAMEHSPSFEVALLVTIQTNYAGWHGMETFNKMREGAR
jgi:hypothetical protein